MKKHSSFTDIGQFRNVVGTVKRLSEFEGFDENSNPILNQSNQKPILKFIGTVKLHGTCGSVVHSST